MPSAPPNCAVIETTNFAAQAADFILRKAHEAINERGLFRVALAGGESPAPVYSELARIGANLSWKNVQVTFGDERCVGPDDPQSNYRMAKHSLLDHVPIPSGNVFRIRGEIDPGEAALEYERQLAAFGTRLGEARYTHDLILLGLGGDGHTASLFPGSETLDEQERNVLPTIGPKPPPKRVTMTLPLINAARHVYFLVSNQSKKKVVDEILAGQGDHPAGKVRPLSGRVTWLIGK